MSISTKLLIYQQEVKAMPHELNGEDEFEEDEADDDDWEFINSPLKKGK